jgi:two-component system nitrogen regulation sensor histidine kinase NtrY
LERRLAVVLAVLAIASGVTTAALMTGSGPGPSSDPELILASVYANIALLLGLGGLVARQLVRIWLDRRQGQAGSRLHLRLAFLFGAVAVTPTLIVTIFSAVFFDVALRGWFSERVATAVNSASTVATAYLSEHRQTIRGDALAMANDLNRDAPFLLSDQRRFDQILSAQTAVRNLTEAVVFDGTGRVLARSNLSFSFDFEPLPEAAMQAARQKGVEILTTPNEDRIRALVYLNQFVDAFLFVGRFVDPALLDHLDKTERAVTEYQELEGKRFDFQLTFAIVFGLVALLLLLAAIWVGLMLADRLARPVSALIGVAERVRSGDLTARVRPSDAVDELVNLSRAFNRMTAQLQSQRAELIDANDQLDERRRFTEAVLAGVTAGVIGLDREGRINLPNRSASRLLDMDLDDWIDRPLAEAVPEMEELLEEAVRRPGREARGQIVVHRSENWRRTFLARIVVEMVEGETTGYVLTFDDITELLQAQRKAAWADVARRIAHEIKNPLTPIQLSAERLKRKYLAEIESDPDTFGRLIETIVRQVGDIGRMVDEFSAFARMPAPVMKPGDLFQLAEQQIDLQRLAHPDITFTLTGAAPEGTTPEGTTKPGAGFEVSCDSRQIRQALTNLLQNAVDSIETRIEENEDRDTAEAGRIEIRLERLADAVRLLVSDNGRGLPDEDRDRLTEPYVTTREKGTGLGLAIVKKIMEDHAGSVVLRDAEVGGAEVELRFETSRRDEPPISDAHSREDLDRTLTDGRE